MGRSWMWQCGACCGHGSGELPASGLRCQPAGNSVRVVACPQGSSTWLAGSGEWLGWEGGILTCCVPVIWACRLGDFDPPASLPWASLNASVIGSPEHAATARQLAAEGTVLLKNEGVRLQRLCCEPVDQGEEERTCMPRHNTPCTA